MANIKDLKAKIKSTKGTYKITSAMKMVSAAKLAKAQAKIQALRPYATELANTVKTVSALATDYSHEYLKCDEENKQAILLVISSDKGLCGGYNNQLQKEVRNFLDTNTDLDFKVQYIGKKVRDLIKKDYNSGKTYTFEKQDPTIDEIRSIKDELAGMFTTGEVGKVFLAYNSFNSVISFTSTIEQLLPMANSVEEMEQLKEEFPFDFKYEPNPEQILDTVIPEVVNTTLMTGILDAIASEHGSRMSAMENASKNCNEMIRTLTLKMNKLRQAAITTELIEVVSGAESLKS